tara:strand:+ start:729 stop:1316 length:588 start_codon:yes stop_codon:yes gene_type:complete
MFNGIIYNTGKIQTINKQKNSILVGIKSKINFTKKDLGASISCDGVCLTITKIKKDIIYFYISKETLKRSNFKNVKVNQIINLEKPLSFGQNISGHFTQGHVDTVAKVKNINLVDKTWIIKFQLTEKKMNKFLIEKASISINGVSLTISKIYSSFFEINVIPHTLKMTNLNKIKINNLVNVELDILSKYIYKFSN